jgi:hypothetical protein
MTGLAEDVLTRVGEDRVVADQDDGLTGREYRDDLPGQGAGQSERGPAGLGEDPTVAGGGPDGQCAGRPKQVGDGAPPDGENRRPRSDRNRRKGGSVKTWEKLPQNALGVSGRIAISPSSVGGFEKVGSTPHRIARGGLNTAQVELKEDSHFDRTKQIFFGTTHCVPKLLLLYRHQ